MMRYFATGLLSMLAISTVSVSYADATPHMRPKKLTHAVRLGCISIAPYNVSFVLESNGCNKLVQFAIVWSNGGTAVDSVIYKALPGTFATRKLRKRATSYLLTMADEIPTPHGGSLLGLISPDHVDDNTWGLSNFSDQNAFVIAVASPPQAPQMYWRVIPANGRDRHIANESITATYAEQEPD